MFDPYDEVKSTVLHNGVKVHVLEVPNCAYAYCNLVFGAGAMHDGDIHAGLAHFVEHMICANSGMTVMQLQDYFAEVGGSFEAATSWFGAWYGFKAPINHQRFDEGLALWSRATLATSLEQYFDREQTIIASEFYQDFASQAHARLAVERQRLLFRGLPPSAAPTPLGTIESLGAITLADVQTFHGAFYVPGNLSVVCVGGLSLAQVCEKLERCEIGVLPSMDAPKTRELPRAFMPRTASRLVGDLSAGAAANQSTVVISALIQREVSSTALNVLCSMIAERAFGDIRENRGLAYSVRASIQVYKAYNVLEIVADDFPSSKLREVERLLRKVIARIPEQVAVFERIRAQECASYLMIDGTWQDVHEKMCADIAREGRIVTMTEELARLEALQFEDVLALLPHLRARQLFTTVMHK